MKYLLSRNRITLGKSSPLLQSNHMSLAKICILLGAIWSVFCLGMSLLGGAVVLFCTSPDIPECGFSGVEVARQWRPVAALAITFFAAGAFFGFRTVAPDLKRLLGPRVTAFRQGITRRLS